MIYYFITKVNGARFDGLSLNICEKAAHLVITSDGSNGPALNICRMVHSQSGNILRLSVGARLVGNVLAVCDIVRG